MPLSSPLNFLIAHGSYGYPEENWFPWLGKQLELYGRVIIPRLPTPDGQSLEDWLAIANYELAGSSPENTVLIGHSSGSILVLRMAERTKTPYRAVFSVCPFPRLLNHPQFDPINTSFVDPPFDYAAIKRGAKHITIVAGDDDPYVPLAHSKEISDALGEELVVIPKGGHLNKAAGYLEFPQLLDKIRAACALK